MLALRWETFYSHGGEEELDEDDSQGIGKAQGW
jgi:hypothetical protein